LRVWHLGIIGYIVFKGRKDLYSFIDRPAVAARMDVTPSQEKGHYRDAKCGERQLLTILDMLLTISRYRRRGGGGGGGLCVRPRVWTLRMQHYPSYP